MIEDYFLRGFYKTANLYKNLATKTLNQAKKSIPKPKADTLDYSKLRSEMARKNIANRSIIKRRLSDISGRPVLTSKNRMY